jgi:hypothetical protein
MFTTTNSEMSTVKRCERLHFYRYGLLRGSLSAKSHHLTDGNDVHEWLEDWWLQRAHHRTPVKPALRAMCHGYDCRYSDQCDQYEVLGVEKELSFSVSDGVRVALKLDGLIRRRSDSTIWVLEHKTSGVDTSPGSDYWTALRLDSQISTYVLACKVNGIDVEGVLYDVLNKPAIKPLLATPEDQRKYTKPTKKDPVSRLYANQRDADETDEEFFVRCLEAIAEDPERYYKREWIRRTDADLKEAANEVMTWSSRVQVNLSRTYLPVRNSTGCQRYGRICDYFGACSGAQQIESYPKLEKRHSELSEEFQ